MKTRLRSPSLFWTFAAACLGMALVGAFLQGVVVIDFLRTMARRSSGLDVVVGRAEEQIAALLARSPDADVTPILTEQQRSLESAVVAFRDVTGRVHYGANLPSRGRPGPGGFGPPRHGPPPGDFELPPGGAAAGPPPRDHDGGPPPAFDHPPPDAGFVGRPRPPMPGGKPPFDAGPDGGRRGPPEPLSVTQRVVIGDRVVGEVVAWQLGPPRVARIGGATRFLLLLPLALLLASLAGLLLFRGVLGRLRALQSLAGRVAEGDLDVRVQAPGADEIGQLGTSLNRMTESLAAAKRAVERTDQERRQLFADISHELATPLTSIRGYAETLLEPSVATSQEERERYLHYIHSASQRMDLLIQDLLELTRLEVGATGLATERIDWVALCRNVVESFAERFEAAGLRLGWSGQAEAAWIQADGRRMEQVVDNLLVNALHYVPRGHSVWVSIESGDAAPAEHRLRVADDGPGFRVEDLPHVFDRFWRGDNAVVANGSGLGLAIVQEIVRRHGGRVRAANRDPHGACIEVDLPAATAV